MRKIIGTFLLVAVLCLSFAGSAMAAQADYYLKLEGIAGNTFAYVAKIDAAGKFSVPNLPMGSYQASIVVIGDVDSDVAPAPVAAAAKDVAPGRAVAAPRDQATGLATGKRQHKPMTFTIEFTDVVISNIATKPVQLAETNGSVTVSPAGSPPPPQGINNSHSNIKNLRTAAQTDVLTMAAKSKELTGHVTLIK